MKYSKIKHFWAWFQENHQHYQEIPSKEPKQQEYWLREFRAHLDAYARGIKMEFCWKKEPAGEMIITLTCGGIWKYFKRIDNLIAKAPVIAGCTFVALRQPGSLELFMDEFEKVSLDPYNILFDPMTITESAQGSVLDVFVEHYGEMSEDFQDAVIAAIYNIVGERVYGFGVRDVYVDTLLGLNQKRKDRLINALELPRYIKFKELSSIKVSASGTLRNHA